MWFAGHPRIRRSIITRDSSPDTTITRVAGIALEGEAQWHTCVYIYAVPSVRAAASAARRLGERGDPGRGAAAGGQVAAVGAVPAQHGEVDQVSTWGGRLQSR